MFGSRIHANMDKVPAAGKFDIKSPVESEKNEISTKIPLQTPENWPENLRKVYTC